MPRVLFTLPAPAGNSGISFLERYGRGWAVVCSWDVAGLECLVMEMKEVKALRWTHAAARETDDPAAATGRLVDVGWTGWLAETADALARQNGEPIGLRHLMLSVENGPRYEFICRGFAVTGADFGGGDDEAAAALVTALLLA
jgi:hypothetical protein